MTFCLLSPLIVHNGQLFRRFAGSMKMAAAENGGDHKCVMEIVDAFISSVVNTEHKNVPLITE